MILSIGDLPLELVSEIYAYADDASKLALRLTCTSFNKGLPRQAGVNKRPHNSGSWCYVKQVHRHLEYDPDRRWCILCHQRYPLDRFDITAPTTAEDRLEMQRVLKRGFDSIGGPGMVPTAADICHGHRAAFIYHYQDYEADFHRIPVLLEFDSHPERRWFTRLMPVCMHCKEFRPLDEGPRCRTCLCDFCGVRQMRFFGRLKRLDDLIGKNDDAPARYVLVRHEGKYWVREEYRDRFPAAYPVLETTITPLAPDRRLV